MDLYTLLKDRASINILKILHDNELSSRYTMRYAEMKELLPFPETPFTLSNLEKAGLITVDNQDSKPPTTILAITKRGSSFISQFDRLKESLNGKNSQGKAFEIKYDITELEQRILVIAAKMVSELGRPVTLTALTQEVYPYSEPASKRNTISKYVRRLIQLNLLEKVSRGNKNFITTTQPGERVIKDQFMEVKV